MRRFLRELRSYAIQFFSNWREYDAPVPRKIWLTMRNRTRSIVTLRGCCGHLGEPGC